MTTLERLQAELAHHEARIEEAKPRLVDLARLHLELDERIAHLKFRIAEASKDKDEPSAV